MPCVVTILSGAGLASRVIAWVIIYKFSDRVSDNKHAPRVAGMKVAKDTSDPSHCGTLTVSRARRRRLVVVLRGRCGGRGRAEAGGSACARTLPLPLLLRLRLLRLLLRLLRLLLLGGGSSSVALSERLSEPR